MINWKRVLVFAAAAIAGLIVFIGWNNRQPDAPAAGHIAILAHRGIAQTFPMAGVTDDTCTARIIDPPKHAFLENTIASMREAFRLGADIVELDVHPTTDGQFAVFHDWTLDCRTDGHGVTREHSMAELKALDIGYGYTADGGRTFPFRGKGVGQMPSLREVLAAFPDRSFLINIKSNDFIEGVKLALELGRVSRAQRGRLFVYAAEQPARALRQLQSFVRILDPKAAKNCLYGYLALGWSGYVPDACRGTVVGVPSNYAGWLWGWPYRFVERMSAAGSRVMLLGPYHGGHPDGIDTAADAENVPPGFDGIVMTNEIETIAPLLRARRETAVTSPR